VTTNSSGYAAITFFPDYAIYHGGGDFYKINVVTTTSVATGSPDSGDGVLPTVLDTANASGARIVSAGCTWWDVAPATGAGGFVIATEWANYDSYANASGSAFTGSSASVGQQSNVTDRRKRGSWVSRPSAPNAYNFNTTDTGVTPEFMRTGVTLVCTGAASTTVLNVEMVLNFEIQVSAESAYSRMVRPNPVSSLSIKAASISGDVESKMSPFIEGGKEAVKRYVHDHAANAIGFVARSIGAAVGGYLGGPPGMAAGYSAGGYIMDVD
jgi:hypothetical protein